MIAAETPMPALADDLGPADDHAADHWVGLDEPLAPGRQLEGPSHEFEVRFVRSQGISEDWGISDFADNDRTVPD